MRVPALVARSGVFSYHDAGGKTIHEWRPPDEVLKVDSIASLKDLPVTNRHPSGFVDPSTWRGVAIGHVSSESPRADATAGGVMADLVISDAKALPLIGKDLIEVSCGYRVDLDETPGIVPEGMPDAGKRYDRIQRNIQQNHVALGPRNWGRQGSAVSMRLDSSGDEIAPVEAEEAPTMKHTIKLDGKEFTAETPEALQALVDAHYADKSRADAAAATAAATAETERLKGENAALTAKVAAEQARADAAPALAVAAIKARAELETAASVVLGKAAKFDGKSDRDVRVAVITSCDSTFKADGKSDEYVTAAFEVWSKAKPAARVDASTRKIAAGLSGRKTDGAPAATETDDPHDVEAARARRDQRTDGAYKKRHSSDITLEDARDLA